MTYRCSGDVVGAHCAERLFLMCRIYRHICSLPAVESAIMEISPLPTPAPEVWVEQFAASLHAQRTRACEFLAAQQKRLEQAGLFVEEQLLQLEEELKGQRDEAGRLHVEYDALTARLATAESRLAEAENQLASFEVDGDRQRAYEDLQRRCELALDDLRQARNKNSELQQQLAKARSTAAKLAQQAQQSGRLDWKRRSDASSPRWRPTLTKATKHGGPSG